LGVWGMFDIGWSELLVIAVVALVVIGPKELPGVLRSVGQWAGKIRRMAAEFQGQFQEAMREAEMADLKKHADDLSESVRSLTANDPYGIARDIEAVNSSTPAKTGSEPSTETAAETSVAPTPAPDSVPPPAEPAHADPAPVADNVTLAPDA